MSTTVMMNDQKVILIWHQFLHSIGHPSQISDPECLYMASQIIAEMADCFLVGIAAVPNLKVVPVLVHNLKCSCETDRKALSATGWQLHLNYIWPMAV